LQPVNVALTITLSTREEGCKGINIPLKNAPEAAVVDDLDMYGMENLCHLLQI
jgi:magnesium chelatase family protein